MEDIDHYNLMDVQVWMLLSKVFDFINTTLIRPRYVVPILPFNLLLGELVCTIIPPLCQIFVLVWWNNIDAIVLGLFNVYNKDLFFVVYHYAYNDRIAFPNMSISIYYSKAILHKGLKGYHYKKLVRIKSLKSMLAIIKVIIDNIYMLLFQLFYICFRIISIIAQQTYTLLLSIAFKVIGRNPSSIDLGIVCLQCIAQSRLLIVRYIG